MTPASPKALRKKASRKVTSFSSRCCRWAFSKRVVGSAASGTTGGGASTTGAAFSFFPLALGAGTSGSATGGATT
eukprot:CAMPEP_0170579788 /NCGR_PEP_ID=MMETSP0224-20130122/6163_1 /TAXON_ID=285029 /ORGANISM="Togula jolla, Strain CCCM 725" /LENGTH=74 /DNA_ID=CAMNT_0010902821 /DNA_START=83 /DNA_END=307 /DNA_ORIENTATION=-